MMENELPTRPAPATGSETIDAEHGIQLGLVEASLSALSSEADDASALVEQLFTWTEAQVREYLQNGSLTVSGT